MATLVLLLIIPIAFFGFVRFEERDRPEMAVLVILGLLVTEALIYPSQNEVPGGLFHPSAGGRALRLPELMIPLALAARLLVRGMPRRIGGTAIAWTAFVTWVALGLPIGVLMENSFDEGYFQAKAVVYLGGGFALVAGIPAARFAHGLAPRRLLLALGIVAGLSAPSALADSSLPLDLPGLPGASLGQISPDAATILSVIAVTALLLEAARRRRRLVYGLAAVPLLLSPFIATQRAAVLGLAATIGALLVVSAGPTWSRRIRCTPTEVGLLVGIILVPVLATITVRAAFQTDTTTEFVPYSGILADTFTAERKVQSAETRENLWQTGLDDGAQYPITGWGLGKTYSVERAAQPGVYLQGGGYHNVLIDLYVRRGLVGLALFLAAVTCTLQDALRTWRRHPDRRIAVFAVACGAGFVGLLAKGMVESVFEKFRLATLMGLLIGAIASAATSYSRSTSSRAEAPQPLST